MLACLALWFAQIQGTLAWLTWKEDPIIQIHNQRIKWVGERTLETRSDGAHWSKECPVVQFSRTILLDGGGVDVPAVEFTDGPLKGALDTVMPIKPRNLGPSTIQITLSPSVAPELALFYFTVVRVPTDTPCTDGWSGSQIVAMITIPRKDLSWNTP
jgi:hypothetical protein